MSTLLEIYIDGAITAFIINIIAYIVFLKAVSEKRYSLPSKILCFIATSIIISLLSWFGAVFIAVGCIYEVLGGLYNKRRK